MSVLVHSGDDRSGHYYAFTRPDGVNWFRFDDTRVEAVGREQVSECVIVFKNQRPLVGVCVWMHVACVCLCVTPGFKIQGNEGCDV